MQSKQFDREMQAVHRASIIQRPECDELMGDMEESRQQLASEHEHMNTTQMKVQHMKKKLAKQIRLMLTSNNPITSIITTD